jgi:hypothetical protein
LLYLLLQGLEVPLHPIYTDGQAVFDGEMLRMFGEYWGILASDNVSKFELSE